MSHLPFRPCSIGSSQVQPPSPWVQNLGEQQVGRSGGGPPMAAKGENKELLLVGLQDTGKTSFLALFYLTLIHGEGLLGLVSFPDDREHLNRISKRLMECQTAVHTQVAEKGSLLLSLEIKKTEQPVGLSIPDLSGD